MKEAKNEIRSDLAAELRPATEEEKTPGLCFREEEKEGFRIGRLTVEKEGEALVGKPAGEYITLEVGQVWLADADRVAAARRLLCGELAALCGQLCPGFSSVLVAGLGNRDLTVDAIGPETAAGITVTRHLLREDPALFEALERKTVSALSPGVAGQTGFETAELLRRAVETAAPDLVLVIDALAARSMERLCTTVQLTDSGICPGSGVGNARQEISRQTMGVPVAAVGVPTVADSTTIVRDVLEQAGIGEPSEALRAVLDRGRGFFVSVRESDLAVRSLSALLAGAIDDMLGGGRPT